MNWPLTKFWSYNAHPDHFNVSPFIDWVHELIDRAKQADVQVEPLSPEEVREFVK